MNECMNAGMHKWMNERMMSKWMNQCWNEWMNEWKNAWMNEWMHSFMHARECMHEWMHALMNAWLNACMHEWVNSMHAWMRRQMILCAPQAKNSYENTCFWLNKCILEGKTAVTLACGALKKFQFWDQTVLLAQTHTPCCCVLLA